MKAVNLASPRRPCKEAGMRGTAGWAREGEPQVQSQGVGGWGEGGSSTREGRGQSAPPSSPGKGQRDRAGASKEQDDVGTPFLPPPPA